MECCESELVFRPVAVPSWADHAPEIAVCRTCRTKYERPKGVTDHAYRQERGRKVCTKCGSRVRSIIVNHTVRLIQAFRLPYPKKNETVHYCHRCDRQPFPNGTALKEVF